METDKWFQNHAPVVDTTENDPQNQDSDPASTLQHHNQNQTRSFNNYRHSEASSARTNYTRAHSRCRKKK